MNVDSQVVVVISAPGSSPLGIRLSHHQARRAGYIKLRLNDARGIKARSVGLQLVRRGEVSQLRPGSYSVIEVQCKDTGAYLHAKHMMRRLLAPRTESAFPEIGQLQPRRRIRQPRYAHA